MSKPTILRLFLSLAALTGLIAAAGLASIPGEAGNALLLGISASRLALLILILLPALACGVLAVSLWASRARSERLSARLEGWLGKRGFPFALALAFLLMLAAWLFFAWPWVLASLGEAIFVRLAPLARWLGWLGILAFLALLAWRDAWRDLLFPGWRPFWRAAFLALGALLLVWGGIAVTGVGLRPDVVGWGAPGAPVVLSQALLACGLGAAVWAVFLLGERFRVRGVWLDLLVCAVLWTATGAVWSAGPILPTHFTPAPRQPNLEVYPYSDAAGYDLTAQNILIGNQANLGVPRKPLYALLLTGMHAAAGQDYESVVGLQVWLLAVIPPLLYLLGGALGSRPAGLAAAVLAAARESNALALARGVLVSHSKMMMSDMPALAVMLLLALFMVAWLRRPEQRRVWPLAIGGLLGLFTLLRGQVLVLLPFVVLAALPALFRRWRLLLEAVALIALGLALTLAPWLWRNERLTGSLTLEDPTQYAFLAAQFSLDPNHETLIQNAAFPEQNAASIRAFVREHPGVVAGFVSAHFFHNLVETIIYLPASFTLETPAAAVARLPFWGEWDGRLPDGAGPVVLLNLALIGLGLSAAWTRRRAAGLAPLILAIGYSLSVTAARYSGWRLILPSDWSSAFYLFLGLDALALSVAAAFGARVPPPAPEKEPVGGAARLSPRALAGVGLILLASGALFPAVEALIPARYVASDPAQVLNLYRDSVSASPGTEFIAPELLENFLQQEGAIALQGRALYPRYFLSGEGEAGHGWPYAAAHNFRRLGFYLAGPVSAHVILASEDVPRPFPNAADVLVFGCRRGDYVDALFVLIEGEPALVHARRPLPELVCPLPEPAP